MEALDAARGEVLPSGAAPRVTTVHRVTLIVGLFVAIILGLVVCFQIQLDASIGVRAVIGGEGLWAKAQKDAVLRLNNYGSSGDEGDYQAYLELIRVPLAFRLAREQLQKPEPDWDVVREGCRQGGLHPVDTEYAVLLFRRFRQTSYLAQAIEHWDRGDRLIAELITTGDELHRQVADGRAKPGVIQAIEVRLADINRRLRVEEDQFSATLAEASRWANDLSRVLTYVVSLLFAAVGIALSWSIIKQIRATENALGESEQRLRAVLEATVDGILVADVQTGRFVVGNRAICDMLGYAPAELSGIGVQDIHPPESLAEIRQQFEGQVSGEFRVARDVPVKCKDGGIFFADVSGAPVLLGGRSHLVGVFHDVTERKQAEAELVAAKQAAESASLAKTHFLAAASHDLRQPLQALGLFHDALAMTGLNPKQQAISERLSVSRHALGELLDRFLDMSRLDAGMIRPEPAVILADDLVAALDDEFSAVARRKNLRFDVWCPRSKLALCSDVNLLLDLLRNLVSNAIKYTERGGVMVSLRRRSASVLIQVWDTGIGIAPAHREQIFDEYFQVGNPERRLAKGVGLGLAIVRRLGQLLGTRVACRSRLGRGSVFEFSLPLSEATEAPPSMVPSDGVVDRSSRFAGKRIVVVEDDPAAAEAIRLSLELHEMRVCLFGTAEDVLGSSEALAADYYVSDYRLPGMDGLHLLEAIQRASATPIKAVLLTGDTSPRRRDLAASSPWTVLYKPVDLPDLLSAIEPAAS